MEYCIRGIFPKSKTSPPLLPPPLPLLPPPPFPLFFWGGGREGEGGREATTTKTPRKGGGRSPPPPPDFNNKKKLFSLTLSSNLQHLCNLPTLEVSLSPLLLKTTKTYEKCWPLKKNFIVAYFKNKI